jgi:hypothetical protein
MKRPQKSLDKRGDNEEVGDGGRSVDYSELIAVAASEPSGGELAIVMRNTVQLPSVNDQLFLFRNG